jgi:hypothetical protein
MALHRVGPKVPRRRAKGAESAGPKVPKSCGFLRPVPAARVAAAHDRRAASGAVPPVWFRASARRSDPAGDHRRAAQQVLADCQRRLDRHRAALEAGTDPVVVQQWIAEVTVTRAAAEAQLRDARTAPDGLTPEQVRDLLEQAGGLVDALAHSDPALRAQLYEELGIDAIYDPNSHTVPIQVELGRRIGRVGGGT